MPEADPIIYEEFFRWHVTPEKLDALLVGGWRRAGQRFYRYSLFVGDQGLSGVVPLRIGLDGFRTSKSQRRILRRNADLTVKIVKARLEDSRHRLFEEHRRRFRDNLPPCLETYLGPRPDVSPCDTVEVGVYKEDRLLAASYLDVGRVAVSSVYAMFDLSEARRSLGIFTTLLEIGYARDRGCRYYYPGYSLDTPSAYDYKKKLGALERYDWKGHWVPLDPQGGS